VLEVLKGDREATEIARVYNIHPVTVSRWKQEFLEKGGEVFGKDTTVAQYEKKGVRKTRPCQKTLHVLSDRLYVITEIISWLSWRLERA